MRKFRCKYFLKTGLVPLALLLTMGCSSESIPRCDEVDRWPFSMAIVELRNQGLLDSSEVNLPASKIRLIASEPDENGNHTQTHLIKVALKDNQTQKDRTLEVMTVNQANAEECSVSGVKVYLLLDDSESQQTN